MPSKTEIVNLILDEDPIKRNQGCDLLIKFIYTSKSKYSYKEYFAPVNFLQQLIKYLESNPNKKEAKAILKKVFNLVKTIRSIKITNGILSKPNPDIFIYNLSKKFNYDIDNIVYKRKPKEYIEEGIPGYTLVLLRNTIFENKFIYFVLNYSISEEYGTLENFKNTLWDQLNRYYGGNIIEPTRSKILELKNEYLLVFENSLKEFLDASV